MRGRIVIVGGGIVGTATALSLSRSGRAPITLVEAEDELATHQSGRNSGVVHSGLYYPPGSLKAELCRRGREAVFELCEEDGVECRRTGKLVVATNPGEVPELDRLEANGRANGLAVRRLAGDAVAELEPHCRAVAALWVPETGVVDFRQVVAAIAARLETAGVEIRRATRVLAIRSRPGGLVVETTAGEVEAGRLINCAGLQSDRVARAAGLRPDLRIVPFRGDYFELPEERRHLVNGLIYPVPDPRYPFLGVHVTRTIDDRVELGPNALWAFAREGYGRFDISLADLGSALGFGGFWRFLAANRRRGVKELLLRARRRFLAQARRLIPELELSDLHRGRCGIRAQAIDRAGRTIDDFHILESGPMLHVLNAPSPAATAALAIGDEIAARLERRAG